MHSYYVYIMASASEVIYIGVTNDIQRRISEHKQKLVEGFTQQYNCTKLIYYEDFSDINEA
ncbi:MAG: GIY-YIG nuclease family protein, partial [Candidatus Magasanikbacteria bacterium]|nr:GIY-YIG nuclease family protein [Candidatus Magasanikbacteria bacterium]